MIFISEKDWSEVSWKKILDVRIPQRYHSKQTLDKESYYLKNDVLYCCEPVTFIS